MGKGWRFHNGINLHRASAGETSFLLRASFCSIKVGRFNFTPSGKWKRENFTLGTGLEEGRRESEGVEGVEGGGEEAGCKWSHLGVYPEIRCHPYQQSTSPCGRDGFCDGELWTHWMTSCPSVCVSFSGPLYLLHLLLLHLLLLLLQQVWKCRMQHFCWCHPLLIKYWIFLTRKDIAIIIISNSRI